MDAGADTGMGTGTDTGTDAGADTGMGTGADTGMGTGAGNERVRDSHEQASSRGYFDGGERAAEAWSAA